MQPLTPSRRALAARPMIALAKYLDRCWHRVSVPEADREDCTQSTYALWLESFGPDGFAAIVAAAERGELGRFAEDREFFRPIDRIKKRTQRRRCHATIDESLAGSTRRDEGAGFREAVREILDPRSAEVILAPLDGYDIDEIAADFGLSLKAVYNIRWKAMRQLRECREHLSMGA